MQVLRDGGKPRSTYLGFCDPEESSVAEEMWEKMGKVGVGVEEIRSEIKRLLKFVGKRAGERAEGTIFERAKISAPTLHFFILSALLLPA